MDRFTGGYVYTGENWKQILPNDPDNPFCVDDLYPCIIEPSYTCPVCMVTSKAPICVKNRSTTKYYCRHCHNEIKKIR